MIKVGISTFSYGWGVAELDIEKMLSRALGKKISLIQIGDNMDLNPYGTERVSAIRQRAESESCEIQLGGRGLAPENLDFFIEKCRQLGCRFLRFVVDGPGYSPSVEDVIHTIYSRKNALYANNIMLAIENHDRLKSRELAYIMRSLALTHVGICLDTVNSISTGEGIETILRRLAPYTVQLHIKDFTVARPVHSMGFVVSGSVAGQGLLDIPSLVDRLRRTGKCRTAVLEQWVPEEECIKKTIQKEREWADDSLNYLRTVRGLTF